MVDFFNRQAQAASAHADYAGVEIDAGLRSYMGRVYQLMACAMAVTGVVAWAISTSQELLFLLHGTPLRWVVMLAPLGMVFLFAGAIHRMRASTAHIVFWVFAALMGASISYIFVAFTGLSIARTFFATAAAFLGLSLYGYVTKRNLTAMGSFMFMGLIGIIVASIVNIFLQSSVLHFAVSAIGVIVFAGLTAYDTQNIKNTYLTMRAGGGMAGEVEAKSAISGALRLYLDFINLFMFLLQFMGNRQ